MNTREEKEKLQKYTIGYLIAMVVFFVVILIGVQSVGMKIFLLIATVLLFSWLIYQQWQRASTAPAMEISPPSTEQKEEPKQEKKSEPVSKPTKKKEADHAPDITTKTGSVCSEPGEYHCSKHPHRTVVMDEGKRFPPCRGDKKGHSAIWVLDAE